AADLGESIAVALVLDPALAGDGDTRAWVTTGLEQLAGALSVGDRAAFVPPGGDPSNPPVFVSARELAHTASLAPRAEGERRPWDWSDAPDREHGGGAIREAIYRAIAALRDTPDLPRRQVVIAISAEPDRGSAHSVDDVIALARRKPEGIRPFTPIYAI